jgi:hypothetical protein
MRTINLTGLTIQADFTGELSKEEEAKAVVDAINASLGHLEGQPQILRADDVEIKIMADDEEPDFQKHMEDGTCPFCGSNDLVLHEPEDCDNTSANRKVECEECEENWIQFFSINCVNHEGVLYDAEVTS